MPSAETFLILIEMFFFRNQALFILGNISNKLEQNWGAVLHSTKLTIITLFENLI